MEILGIDIGGTGMKGAKVNTTTGELVSERFRIPTPDSKKPKDMAKVFSDIVKHFNYNGPVGCGFPPLLNTVFVKHMEIYIKAGKTLMPKHCSLKLADYP